MVLFPQNWFRSGKLVVIGQIGSFWAKWLYSDKSGCIRVKVVEFGQSGCIRAKVVLIRQKWLHSGKSDCSRAKWFFYGQKLYLCKSGCIPSKAALFVESGCIWAK